MSVFVKPLMDWFMFGMVIETGPKFYMVPFPAQKVTDSEFLYKSFVINVLQFVFLQSLQWILFSCGVTIEPCLKFYVVPSQSQCMTLRSSSKTLIFFCVLNLYSVSSCKAFDWFESCLVWMDIRFKNASERKSASQASCPVQRQVLLSHLSYKVSWRGVGGLFKWVACVSVYRQG